MNDWYDDAGFEQRSFEAEHVLEGRPRRDGCVDRQYARGAWTKRGERRRERAVGARRFELDMNEPHVGTRR